jgi:phosphotransferase system IIB component
MTDDIKHRIKYEPETGIFVWVDCKKKSLNGKNLGVYDKDGYLTAKINQIRYRLHRLAWFVCYGKWPSQQIDHINGIKDDNRLCNLRLANNSENNCNRPAQSNNLLGVRGVRFNNNRYQALICKDKKQIVLGSFKTLMEAQHAYQTAAKELHGDYRYVK